MRGLESEARVKLDPGDIEEPVYDVGDISSSKFQQSVENIHMRAAKTQPCHVMPYSY